MNAPLLQRSIYILLLFCGFSVITACTTQKSRDDVSGLGKLWHNTTAHYNGYFNAKELMDASLLSLEGQNTDNFSKVLPVFEFMGAENPQAVKPDMDLAIEKVATVVRLHRVSQWTDDCYLLVGQAQYLQQDYEAAESTLRYLQSEYGPKAIAKKEAAAKKRKKRSKKKGSSAADRSYDDEPLSKKERERARKQQKKERDKRRKQEKKERERQRKAYEKARAQAKRKGTKAPPRPSYKSENETEDKSQDTLVRTTEEPVPSIIRLNRVNELSANTEADPDAYFLKHKPAHQVGKWWLALTLIERDNYDAAFNLIQQLENDPKTFKEVRENLAPLAAHFYMEQKQYDLAVKELDKATDLAKNRDDKARYAFIAGQLHQLLGNQDAAYAAFQKVSKLSSDYDFIFSSKLNIAQSAYSSGKRNSEDALQDLERMLKDPKNALYKDRIYYAMGMIALDQNNEEAGIKYLTESVNQNSGSPYQQGTSYLQLADLYFDKGDYVSAQSNYGLALARLNKTDERYERVERYNSSLKEIVEQITFIEHQDSLLRIGAMSADERKQIASELKREQDEARRNKLKNQASGPDKNNPRAGATARIDSKSAAIAPALKKESSFFAYNDRALKRGKRAFQDKWGDADNRPLVDNWRLSSKLVDNIIGEEEEDVVTNEEPASLELTDEEIKKILKDVPVEDSERLVAERKLQESMYNLGRLYRENLNNNEKAVEMLERLDKTYPGNSYEKDSWYILYISHIDLGNTAQAATYKDKLINRYPTSAYAQILQNPNGTLAGEHNKLEAYYQETYQLMNQGNYQEALSRSKKANTLFGTENVLQPKFALVSAMSIGNIDGREAYIKALREVAAKFPNTEEQKRAKEMLRVLGASAAALPGGAKEGTIGEDNAYIFEPDRLHYAIVAFDDPQVKLENVKNQVSDYHLQYHKLDRLRTSTIILGTDKSQRTPLLVIRRFNDKDAAMKYFNGIQQNASNFIDPAENPFRVYMISQNNYRAVLKSKSIGEYPAFFEEHYK